LDKHLAAFHNNKKRDTDGAAWDHNVKPVTFSYGVNMVQISNTKLSEQKLIYIDLKL